MMTMAWLSILIDLASIKWRWMASSIIYFEGIFMILGAAAPSLALMQLDGFYLNTLFLMVFAMCYCDQAL